MTELSQVSIEDMIIKREIPVLDPEDNLHKAINEMIKHKVSTAIFTYEKGFKLITSKICARKIVENIWKVDTIVERIPLSNLFKDVAITDPLHLSDPSTKAIKTILERRDNYIVSGDGEFYEITGEDALPLFILWEDDLESEAANNFLDEVVMVPPTQSAVSTYEKYSAKNLTAAIVVNPARQPIGIVTNRDYTFSYKELIKLLEKIKPERDMKIDVEKVMKKEVIFEFEDQNIMTIINDMVENDIGHIPIVDKEDQVVGVIYKYTLLKHLVRLDEGS